MLGISDQSTKLCLLKEEDLTLNKAVNICRSSEIANIQLKSMKVSSKEVEEVHAVHGKTHRKSNKTPFNGGKTKLCAMKDHQPAAKSHNSSKRKCYRCGRLLDHKLKDCPAFGQTCNSCGKENHFASVCLSSKQSTCDVRAVDELDKESLEESKEEPIFCIEDVSSIKAQGKQLYTRLNFLSNSHRSRMQLECQLDTRATCNVMSYDVLSRITQTRNPPLQSSEVKLCFGSLMKPIGATSLAVENHNDPARRTTKNLVFQVIETNNKPLLSAETCQKLALIQLNIDTLHSVAETNTPLSREEILSTYKDVFEGLGHIGNASFVIDDKCTPVQHAPRRIPVTIRKEVKEKMADLEGKGIIKKETEPTEWISSMVVVAKPNKIRICLDPKDLNKALKRPKYQMPTLEELLPKLNNAKVFSTLDAKDGFYQIALDDASSKLTTFWTPFGRYRYL